MGESDPEGQSVHVVELVVFEYLPFIQRMQVADDEDPNVLEYLPASHVVHVLADETPEYAPW